MSISFTKLFYNDTMHIYEKFYTQNKRGMIGGRAIAIRRWENSAMNAKEEFKEKFSQKRPKKWEKLPDIQLYMDQIISYLQRQHIGLSEGEELTSSMVNNYVKKGLLPRANGKRYEKEHIAYLTMICLFKQVLTVPETDDLLKLLLAGATIEDVYEQYRLLIDEKFDEMAALFGRESSCEEQAQLALALAVDSYASKLLCEKLIAVNKVENETGK